MIPQFSTIQRSYQYFINMLPAYDNVMNMEKECLENNEIKESNWRGYYSKMLIV